ncbi:MAG: TonB-dependent receptor [Balneola sp.]|nr:MAG: TonB-dependent receptor [Balneola sp.]
MVSISRIYGPLLVVLALLQGSVNAQTFSYSNKPFLSVISDIERQTPYRFLYREALVSDIKITLTAEEDNLMEVLSENLQLRNIGLKIDKERFQALVYSTSGKQKDQKISISGFILDSKTGERLPYSTISWRDEGKLYGTSSTPNGTFHIEAVSNAKNLTFLVSFVGYEPQRLNLSFDEITNWANISIRLEPEPFSGSEILIQGINFYTASDSVLSSLVKVGTFNPLGENNSVRSLQSLPSVSMSSAVNNGINIRGSAADGFQVLLDGQTIYHQSHLFGLLDAMNPDALKTSGFYYDITPAQFQAPLGGTLSLITRTGSLNRVSGSAGFSNTATKATLEGPLAKGKASWLFSGRISHMDELNWFNNQGLIEYGLDVQRPAKVVLPEQVNENLITDVRLNTFDIQNTDARFYDLHSKIYVENARGGQLTLSGYIGSDESSQSYFRDEVDIQNLYETINDWNSQTASASFNTILSDNTFSETSVGISSYGSEYSKGDFEYQIRRGQNDNGPNENSSFLGTLNLENSLQEFSAKQNFHSSLGGITMDYGINYSDFDVEYVERSLTRQSFRSRRTSQLVDVFHQLDINSISPVQLRIGNRVHYFSNGRYLRWSPRIKAEFEIDEPLTVSLGYSKNHQFINRLQFYNINSSDFWILSNEDQAPSSVNYYSAAIRSRYFTRLYIQAEAYIKDYDNLRFHELNSNRISSSFRTTDSPWFFENEGIGRGVEFFVKSTFSKITLSSAYTLSSIELRNPRINDGEYFYADWDRRHQFSFAGELDISRAFDFYLAWTYGSGTPDRLNDQIEEDEPRLPYYSRFDASLNYNVELNKGSLRTSFSVYNLLNRNNPWYSEIRQITIEARNRRDSIGSSRTDIYDLGIQPSFNIAFYF